MSSPLFHKLQKFDCKASSKKDPDHYIAPRTASQLIMTSQKETAQSVRLSLSQQKSPFQTQALTQSQTSSSIQVVENICNQIKYLIEGNLKSNNTQCNLTDFVRQNVIPMLIKMFFQTPKTDFSMGDSFGNPKQQFKDITNNFGIRRAWKTNPNMKEQQSSEEFSETFKSAFIRKTHMEQHQNSENDEKINEENSPDRNSSEGLNLQFKFTNSLYMSILLLKALVVRKSSSFQKIKFFGQFKQRKIVQFIGLVRKTQVKKCVQKFWQNRTKKLKQIQNNELEIQSRKFNKKRMNLSCQIIGKIVRMRLKTYFRVFKENSFSQNKYIHQWVRYAALRSPLTVKTSIWRLKQFMVVEDPQKLILLKNQDSVNKQAEKQVKISTADEEPKLQNKKVAEPDVSQIDYQSQEEQSISSNEFDKMFQGEEDQENFIQSPNRPSLDKMIIENQQNLLEQLIQEQKKFEDNEYLRTISEDEHENSSMCQ